MAFKISFIVWFSSLSCLSQVINKEFAIKQAVQNCSLILEGKAEPAGKAFRGSNKVIYTPYPVVVTRVISGEIISSKIMILLEGGQIEENGMGYATGTPHGINFLSKVNCIIFCSKSETTNFPNSYLAFEQVCYKPNDEIIPMNFLSEFYKNRQVLLKDIVTTLKNLSKQ